MKNAMLFYYNLDISELKLEDNSAYSFYIDYEKFYLYRVDRPQTDIDEMLKIVKNYPNFFHRVIPNKSGAPVTKIEEYNYILLKITGPEHNEIDLRDIMLNQIPYNGDRTILERSNWGTLWSEKVDYLEYQVSELATTHPIIKKSFSYYVGLAENAISYYNLLNPESVPLYLSHRRIKANPISRDYYNPLNLIVDYRVRDIASYLKIQFFYRGPKEILKEVDFLIEKNILTPLEYNLLFCRLLYPSYYFDELSNVLEKNTDEQTVLTFIENASKYEEFLNEVFNRFTKKSSMIKIDWLIKT